MTNSSIRTTAKIYQFPIGRRATSVGETRAAKQVGNINADYNGRAVAADCGYHETAMQDAYPGRWR